MRFASRWKALKNFAKTDAYDFGAGFDVGRGGAEAVFFCGLEMPMLIITNFSPVRILLSMVAAFRASLQAAQ